MALAAIFQGGSGKWERLFVMETDSFPYNPAASVWGSGPSSPHNGPSQRGRGRLHSTCRRKTKTLTTASLTRPISPTPPPTPLGSPAPKAQPLDFSLFFTPSPSLLPQDLGTCSSFCQTQSPTSRSLLLIQPNPFRAQHKCKFPLRPAQPLLYAFEKPQTSPPRHLAHL